ncbi:hypothetical protein TVAG_219210 [Trichomonas vaginalis G3]|uniref:GH18 domain-containing protein n=1 Tax=Trichomonas vaginalis (strain ATCC PRA-98 / G3) TaxID=412133 RepID=A2FKQ3_TRIV3|nr:concanavalin A-like lectin/glucanases superfamily [Trichomonas vaginalis G3]EAX94515.1 hypothetical protein TVAG_219210 [Trichomonas vaginalis G3]KAI5501097.1 concanavalin A-like lectin/glucanases superfamily [Trichomonas vaginalis G3]|eukprot:XP_001307445.1 hypothetical protein [Trichomonas vaginalis G3]
MALNSSWINDYMRNGMSFPDYNKWIPRLFMLNIDCDYKFDKKYDLGYNTYNWKEFHNTLLKPYTGRRGYKIMLSWQAHNDWLKTLANVQLREKLATNVASVINEGDIWDGTDVDFEYPYSKAEWTVYGEFLKLLRQKVNSSKLVSFTPHAYIKDLPKEYMQYLDYVLFQCYGPNLIDVWKDDEYIKIYNNVLNSGYPRVKIVLSYSTTTSYAFIDKKHNNSMPDEELFKNLWNENFTRDTWTTNKEGYDYYFNSYNSVYFRAKYMRQQRSAGTMYWDTISDLRTDHPLSLAKAQSFALEGNVDLIVDKVENAPPTPYPYPTPIPTPSPTITETPTSEPVPPSPNTPSPEPSRQTPSTKPNPDDQKKKTIIIASASAAGGLVVIIIVIVVVCLVRKKEKQSEIHDTMMTLV